MMTVSEYERTQLFRWFEEHMGKDRASTMMNLLPPAGWGDVATTRDMDHLRVAMSHDIERLRADMTNDMAQLRADMTHDMAQLRADMTNDMAQLRADMTHLGTRLDGRIALVEQRLDVTATKGDLESVRADLQRTFVQWLLMSQATIVAAMSAMFAVLYLTVR